MPSKGEGILLSDLAICVGIVDRKREQKRAHLVVLEQPQDVRTKHWKSEETFKTGKWQAKPNWNYHFYSFILQVSSKEWTLDGNG